MGLTVMMKCRFNFMNMTKDQTDELNHQITILTAIRDGKAVQCRRKDGDQHWSDIATTGSALDFEGWKWRIKPVLYEGWFVVDFSKRRLVQVSTCYPDAFFMREVPSGSEDCGK